MTGSSGFVYIFRREDGLRKPGWMSNIERRRSRHRSDTGLSYEIEMAWEMGNLAAFKVEQSAHRSLTGLGCSWSREVYDLPLAKIIDAVQNAIERIASELPNGLVSQFPPRYGKNSIPRLPENWDCIVAEANAYLLEHPDLLREIAEYANAVAVALRNQAEAKVAA